MNEEVYARIEAKLDKHTDMLMAINIEVAKEVSVLKLAQQRLKYVTTTLAIVFALKVAIDLPKLVIFVKTIL